MAVDALATLTVPEHPTLEPSRAWILGLVVGSDGSLSGPGSERTLEWPACGCPGDCDQDHEVA